MIKFQHTEQGIHLSLRYEEKISRATPLDKVRWAVLRFALELVCSALIVFLSVVSMPDKGSSWLVALFPCIAVSITLVAAKQTNDAWKRAKEWYEPDVEEGAAP